MSAQEIVAHAVMRVRHPSWTRWETLTLSAKCELLDIADAAIAAYERAGVSQNHDGLARRDHGRTAKQAAKDVAPRSGTQRWRVLDFFGAVIYGATRDEVAEYLRMSPNTVRPRIKELLDHGYLRVTDATRPSALGRDQEVLVITEKGRLALGRPVR